eukprot:SAG22_NODE_6184_length_888_cov_1.484157_2_plen_79_part_00
MKLTLALALAALLAGCEAKKKKKGVGYRESECAEFYSFLPGLPILRPQPCRVGASVAAAHNVPCAALVLLSFLAAPAA